VERVVVEASMPATVPTTVVVLVELMAEAVDSVEYSQVLLDLEPVVQ
jgi:hypothetical protein